MPKITPRKSDKAKYVKSQGQNREHHCHWYNCDEQVPPAMWGCKKHWFLLPKCLRDKIWDAYRPGQETDMTPSKEYLAVAEEVQQWIYDNRCKACDATGKSSKGGSCYPCDGKGIQK